MAVLALLLVSFVTATQFRDSKAGPGDLLLVTSDGGITGRNGDLHSFLSGLGWTVRVIDDDDGGLLSAAESSDVVYAANGLGAVGAATLRDAEVGVVSEESDRIATFLYGTGATDAPVSLTQLDVHDDASPITAPMGAGAATLFTAAQSIASWSAGTPSGVDVLVSQTSDSSRAVLMTAESGDQLFSAMRAPGRRVITTFDGSAVTSWNAAMQSMVERSIDWAMAAPTPDGRPDLLFVTGTGTLSAGDEIARRNTFESLGWDVHVTDEGSTLGELTVAAAQADLMYLADSSSPSLGTTIRNLDIGIVAEDVSNWQHLMYGSSATLASRSVTSVNVADASLYPTSVFAVGGVTTTATSQTHSFFDAGVVPLPAGAQPLIDMVADANEKFLVAFESGSTMYGANTAADRRALGGWANITVANWGANLQTIVDRSMIWAAGMVVVNSTDDDADATPGDGLCDTGATNSDGDTECTLRAAIEEANATSGIERIVFDMPTGEAGHASGVWTISAASALPVVTAAVSIDARTHPGWAGTPIVAVDGVALGAGEHGITLSGTGIEIHGLAITSFPGSGISAAGSGGHVLTGNYVGLRPDGTTAAGNAVDGIAVVASNNTIGGVVAYAGNTIAHNSAAGVSVVGSTNDGNTIISNNVFSNGGLGIDLGGIGVTENDATDADTGPNDELNFPVISSFAGDDVDFGLDVPAGDYLVEAFRNPGGADPSGNGEGEISLGTQQIAHTGSGIESFTATFAGLRPGGSITMTVTECDTVACASFGSTSEFSD